MVFRTMSAIVATVLLVAGSSAMSPIIYEMMVVINDRKRIRPNDRLLRSSKAISRMKAVIKNLTTSADICFNVASPLGIILYEDIIPKGVILMQKNWSSYSSAASSSHSSKSSRRRSSIAFFSSFNSSSLCTFVKISSLVSSSSISSFLCSS